MAKRIVLTGGGTGGHLYPLVTVAEYIRENRGQQEEIEFLFLGPVSQLEKEVMDSHNIKHKHILAGKMRRYFSFQYLTDLIKIPLGFFQSLWHLFWFMPEVLYAKGGFASVPVVLAAKIYGIPVLIHESDAFPGLANRFLGSVANRIAICFERAKIHFPPSRTFLSGMPIKKEALGGRQDQAREFLKMNNNGKPVVLFLGGSQGAKAINDEVISIIKDLILRYQVVHQTGKLNYEEVCQKMKEQEIDLQGNDYRPLAFIGSEMKDLIALADVVVSRAGSTAIAEMAANEKPSILIPLSTSANDHQRINAYEVAKAGAAIALEESNFKRGMLLHNLEQILNNQVLRENLKKNITQFYYPDATEKIAKEVLSLAEKNN